MFSKSGIGNNNEDYALYTEIAPGMSLVVVCDGMGGLSYGAKASRLIAESIEKYLKEYYKTQTPRQAIISAIFCANDEIARKSLSLHTKMGASVGLALFMEKRFYYSWMGDVRIYINQGGRTRLLTKDHLAIEGNHSFITSCINGRTFRHLPIVEELELCCNDEIIISTDGYYLHNIIGNGMETTTTLDDDATIVSIKYTLR